MCVECSCIGSCFRTVQINVSIGIHVPDAAVVAESFFAYCSVTSSNSVTELQCQSQI